MPLHLGHCVWGGKARTTGPQHLPHPRGFIPCHSSSQIQGGHLSMLRRVADRLKQRSPSALTAMGLVMVVAIGAADRRTPAEMSFAIFYLVPILFVTWFAGRRAGIFIAVACGLAWFAADEMQTTAAWKSFIPYWNLMSRSAAFLAVAYSLSLVKTL